MSEVLTGTTVVAAFLGGVVALFAPCCVSVMLPAYLATSFRRRTALAAMTFVFAAGVAAVVLPIALGASWVTRLIVGQHTAVFLVVAAFMVALGVATLAERKLPLPMPGGRAAGEHGAASVFALGAFSGVASACCAPVLAGVVTLAGAVASFSAALVVGVAYVFGMVVPLFVIALLWDRYEWGDSALFRGRTVTVGFGRLRRSIALGALLSGGLLIAMGGLLAALAVTGPAMDPGGWQARMAATVRHWADMALSWVDGVPGWVSAAVIFASLAALARAGSRQYLDRAEGAARPDAMLLETPLETPRAAPAPRRPNPAEHDLDTEPTPRADPVGGRT